MFSSSLSDSYAASNVSAGSASYYVGGLVGWLDVSTVSACNADGNVTSGKWYGGGLAGVLSGGTVSQSYATGSVTGLIYTGGLVGMNYNAGTITDCDAAASVNGGSCFGGLVGYEYYSTLANSYAIGAVSNGGGGLCGYQQGGPLNNSYWDTQTTGQTASSGGIGRTTAQMMQQATFSGWDFTNTWGIVEGVTYPYLFGEFPEHAGHPDQQCLATRRQ